MNAPGLPQDTVFTVSQITDLIKEILEGAFRTIAIEGEISNWRPSTAGHIYFTLKDSDAQIRCVMFRSYACRVPFKIADGMQVILKGRVSIYERDGQYQFYAEEIHPVGEGDLSVAFNRLKEKLEKEGLFSPENKRPIKRFPRKIAVLTANTGAAVHDILNITAKRYPICEILLCPVTVQGDTAAASMIDMLERVYRRDDIDTIIIGRGGGSLEDLWAFNDENLARKIYRSPIPVISAVGHETDFTICDFVADVRASTPSHAAELAVPDMSSITAFLDDCNQKLRTVLISKHKLASARYELTVSRSPLYKPDEFFDALALKTDTLTEKIRLNATDRLADFEKRFSDVTSRIDALSPLKTISRGFAAVSYQNARVQGVADIEVGHNINLRFFDGEADCKVTALRSEK